jgi:subtilase family serine protease
MKTIKSFQFGFTSCFQNARRSMAWAMLCLAVCTFFLFCAVSLFAQSGALKRPLITQSTDENNLVTLPGNTRPEVRLANDQGLVADDLQMEHMYLQLKRSPEQQEAVEDLINRLHDQKAPEYHQWLTADQIAERFGPAEEVIQVVSDWLESHGFSVNVVYRPNGVIDFSGPASAIREAFHTEIHRLDVNGKPHIANVSDPQVPAALAPAIQGVVSMNDFRPYPLNRPRAQYTFTSHGATHYPLVPGDLATIYNMNPLYAEGITGKGQTIVVIEDSNIYTPDDWHTFRKTFGLEQEFPQGSFRQIHPQPSDNPNNAGPCGDPGVNPDDAEAAVDAEWASAAAPAAAIVLASCADTTTNFGGYIAMQNMLTAHGRPPGIFSISCGSAEPQNGATWNAYINELYEIAVLQGVSVFVAAGDWGADTSDYWATAAVSGINVSGMASTPNNVAVGGTDFADTYFLQNATYWSATNGTYFNSALSYIPEIPWNQSCAGQLITTYFGYATPYGTGGFCNSALGEEYFLTTIAGGGGPSGCAFGAPSIYGVVGGTCRGYPKPFYQKFVMGNPRDGVRDLPDVSLFASIGFWNHWYVVCYSDASNGGTPCAGPPLNWSGFGGTSFGAPIMAGIQAMINQAAGGYHGNPNFVYYPLAALEYGFGGAAACNSTLGNQVSPRCIFYDVTLGDIDVDCQPMVDAHGNIIGTFNCYLPGGTYGVLSLSNSSYEPAYPATRGWDFATGLGSVNAYNLVRSWPGVELH